MKNIYDIAHRKYTIPRKMYVKIKGVYKKMSNFEIHTLTQSIFNLQISFKYQWNCLENTVSMMSIKYFYDD